MRYLYIYAIILILIGCESIDQKIKSNNKISNAISSTKNYLASSKPTITITSDASKTIDENFGNYNLQQSDLQTLKKILSDPNPDPENKAGQICETNVKKCKWDNESFEVQTNYITYQAIIEMLSNPFAQMGLGFTKILGKDDELKNQIHQLCIQFENGNRYECSEGMSASDYCSEKCKYEAKQAGY